MRTKFFWSAVIVTGVMLSSLAVVEQAWPGPPGDGCSSGGGGTGGGGGASGGGGAGGGGGAAGGGGAGGGGSAGGGGGTGGGGTAGGGGGASSGGSASGGGDGGGGWEGSPNGRGANVFASASVGATDARRANTGSLFRLTGAQERTWDAFRKCAPDSAFLDQLRTDGSFTFQALTRFDVNQIKECMRTVGYRFDY